MQQAEIRALETGALLRPGARPMMSTQSLDIQPKESLTPRARYMVIPIAAMVILMPVFLIMTGRESVPAGSNWLTALQAGSGSTSVLYATSFATALAMVMNKLSGRLGIREMFDLSLKAMSGMLPLALLMVMAFAIGTLCRELGTGTYIAQTLNGLIWPGFLPALIFVSACFVAFSTGTSWGTFAIMIPIAVPLALTLDMNTGLMIAAALGGGIFGDHCSPTSDTSIITSMATANDHIDHVRTQLPYALIGGAITIVIYLILGHIYA